MWQQDRDKIPASELMHLSNDNMRFALALRKDEELNNGKQSSKRPVSSHQSRSKVSARDDLTKPVECRNTVCLRREEDIILGLHEVSLLSILLYHTQLTVLQSLYL